MTTATESVSGWLSDFQVALDRGDIDGAAAMFAEESYWRDLVSFTWNIKTLEGRGTVRHRLVLVLHRGLARIVRNLVFRGSEPRVRSGAG